MSFSARTGPETGIPIASVEWPKLNIILLQVSWLHYNLSIKAKHIARIYLKFFTKQVVTAGVTGAFKSVK